jgi:mannose-6-phosphate isomerase-like protein (cupin superfamily)
MTIITNTQVPFQHMPGLQHQTLAGSDEGLKHLSVWRQTMAPGAATPPHRHDCEEVVLVASGSGEVHMGGEVLPFGPDSTLVIPPNVDHQIFNTGTDPLVTVAAFAVSPVEVKFPDGTVIELPWRT